MDRLDPDTDYAYDVTNRPLSDYDEDEELVVVDDDGDPEHNPNFDIEDDQHDARGRAMKPILALLLCLLPGIASAQATPGTPWWATTLAVAGPLADGLSTVYASRQSGPYARVIEGNGFYGRVFGSDVTAGEIMAFKVGQAALFGAIVHYAGKQPERRTAAIGVAIATAVINGYVTSLNIRTAHQAQRANGGRRVSAAPLMVICAWCKAVLRFGRLPASHGCCKSCAAKLLETEGACHPTKH